jgi:hypothetical protein
MVNQAISDYEERVKKIYMLLINSTYISLESKYFLVGLPNKSEELKLQLYWLS